MSGRFPSTPAANSLKISSLQPTRVSITQSLKRQVRTTGSQRFSLQVGFAPMTREQFAPISAFIDAQAGQFEAFQYVPPIEGYTSGEANSVITVNGAHSKGSNTLTLSGANASLQAGDYIVFSNHSKVYKVLSSGQNSIAIMPTLMSSVPSGDVLIYNAVPFTVARGSDLLEYTVSPGGLYQLNLEFVEVY